MLFDNLQLKLAETWEVLIPEFSRNCVTMRGPNYGAKLVKWDKDRCHLWDIVGYQKAQHILCVQQSVMDFLRRALQGLIEETRPLDVTIADDERVTNDANCSNGKDATGAGPAESSKHIGLMATANGKGTLEHTPSPKWDQLVLNKFFSFGSSSAQSVRAAANQPFSAPPHFDPVKTLELVESMYHASVDDLEPIQTDPAYLQYLVRELGATACFERIDSESRWDWYMDEIECFYRRFLWWHQMLKECRNLMDMYEQ